MKLKVRDVLNAKEPLGIIVTSKISVSVAYKLLPTIDAVEKAINDYEKIRVAKIHSYGETKDNKTEVLPKNMKVFMEEIEEAQNQEIELPDFTLSLKMLEEKNLEIEPVDLQAIKWLITDDTN